jgi:phenylacetate-CoA ligase
MPLDYYHIYLASPRIIQHLMINTWVYRENKKRFDGVHDPHLRWLSENVNLSAEEFYKTENERLRDIIKYSYEKVPAYKKRFDSAGVKPDEIRCIEDLQKIPTLSKEEVKSDYNAFISSDYRMSDLDVGMTSGTTGTPFKCIRTLDVYRKFHACVTLLRQWNGTSLKQPSVSFGGKAVVSTLRTHPPFWQYNCIWNQTYFSIQHMSPHNLPDYVKQIRRIKPVFMAGYPSAITMFGKFLLETGVSDVRPKAIFLNSEMVYPWQKKIIEEAFGAKIVEWYSTQEILFFAYKCNFDHYHILPGMGIIELLADGNQMGPGKAGEVVATTLINRASPLIRFKLLDSAVWGKGECGCGSKLPFIHSIVGRVQDMIVTPDGNFFAGGSRILRAAPDIVEGQVIQETLDKFTVRLVPGKEWKLEYEKGIREKFQYYYPYDAELTIEIVDRIPRTAAGKIEAVISMVNRKNELAKKEGFTRVKTYDQTDD